jgi:hypothetical protein
MNQEHEEGQVIGGTCCGRFGGQSRSTQTQRTRRNFYWKMEVELLSQLRLKTAEEQNFEDRCIESMQQRRLAKSNGLDGSPVKVGSLAAGASSTKKRHGRLACRSRLTVADHEPCLGFLFDRKEPSGEKRKYCANRFRPKTWISMPTAYCRYWRSPRLIQVQMTGVNCGKPIFVRGMGGRTQPAQDLV